MLECERWRVEGERERRRVGNAASGVGARGIRVVPREGDGDGEEKPKGVTKDEIGDRDVFKRPDLPSKGTGAQRYEGGDY